MKHRSKQVLFQTDQMLPLLIIAALVISVRLTAAFILDHPLESDSLAYFTMAQGLAERGELLDQYDQHVFYSAGYPLVLTPLFMLLGSNISVVLAANMTLALISMWLVFRMALDISANRIAAVVAASAYAFWLPGVWNATIVVKENLSTPLMLGLTLCAIHIARDKAPVVSGLFAGFLCGASLLTGGSTLFLFVGIGIAQIMLWRLCKDIAPAFKSGLSFMIGTLIVLAPWLHATDRMVGRPVLTTNAAFNLYLGNNPAATGRFVSIADTPMGSSWNVTRVRLGEIRASDVLQAKALRWIQDNPSKVAILAVRKLALFWSPNVPDSADFQASKAVAIIRLFEVIQYGMIVVLGIAAFQSKSIGRDSKWIIAAIIFGFWFIHAATYIIPRYRDPVIPLLIILASISITAWLQQRMPFRKWHDHGV